MSVLTRVATCLASALLLVGCSATAPATAPTTAASSESATPTAATSEATSGTGTQSISEACNALNAAMADATSTMQSAMSEIGSDPSQAVKALEAFEQTFADSVASVDNAEVKAQAEKALAATKKMVSALEAVIKDPTKAASLQDVVTEFQSEMTELGTVCTG
ncbi:MAG: hypothetical protein QM779_14995 [Propionicimonas sp.]|uniref:hypothetical protein n=1 Tax=Propionicimonas sp. TaxID=1955623 RepID=UPI003D0D2476